MPKERLVEPFGSTKGCISEIERSDKAPPFSTLGFHYRGLHLSVCGSWSISKTWYYQYQ